MAAQAIYYPPVGFHFQVEFNLLLNASNLLNVNNLENTLSNAIAGPSSLLTAAGINVGSAGKVDMSFQEVGGLKANVQVRELTEGGENRFKHLLPERISYEKLVLKRGLATNSAVFQWCMNTIANFEFKPVTLFVKLMDEDGQPLVTWEVINAYPIGWTVGNFNAESNSVVIEEMTLAYQYFNVKTN
jgi:phage tail-like protein